MLNNPNAVSPTPFLTGIELTQTPKIHHHNNLPSQTAHHILASPFL